jgi:hypothetical protein
MLLGPHLPREIAALEVVRTDELTPLTQVNPLQVERVATALRTGRVLRHPLLTLRTGAHLAVLDGHARLAAARQLDLSDLLVQVVSTDRLIAPLKIYPFAALNVTDEEVERVTEGVFRTSGERSEFSLRLRRHNGSEGWYAPPPENPVELWDAFLAMVNALRSVADIETVPRLSDWSRADRWPKTARALLIPPALSLASLGRLLDAGIRLPWGAIDTTTFRRILGLNLSLDVLSANEPPGEKTAFVRELVRLRQSERRIHYYDSPVYIFED